MTELEVPISATEFGFVNGPGGTHTSRTIMLSELRLLLAACPRSADFEQYRSAIVDENILLKKTVTTRLRSFRGLRELYGLKPGILIFRALRDLWDEDKAAQPLLALLCATARDPVFRATGSLLLGLPTGADVTPRMLADGVNESFAGRYNPEILAKIGRNAASSWRQSGHLSGRLTKVRSRAESRPAAVAYALLLAYLCDARGETLFQTQWSQLLDAPLNVLHSQAFAASQSGWLEYRHSGGVTDISFRYLLREKGQGFES